MPRGRTDHDKLIEQGKNTRFTRGKRAAECGRKGGINSQKAYSVAKRRREMFDRLAKAEASPDAADKVRKVLAIEDEELVTNDDLITLSVFKSALKGDSRARDQYFELTAESRETTASAYELPARVLGKAFVDTNRNIEPNKTYVFEGGRGALKSSFVSLKIVELVKNNPTMHACVVRKVAGTLKDSVYAQMTWAIKELNLEEEFEFKKNPLEIVLKKTGQTIYFRGADDPIKLKSIKPPFGYIGILWKEEKDQLAGPEEERSINQSVLRGNGTAFYDFSSYNPPKSKDSWVNRELLVPDPNRIVHHSTFLEAPPEWLGQKFIDDALHLQEVNPAAYEHEYLGVANGEGGAVFASLIIAPIPDEKISHFDTIYQGVDWGNAPDPSVVVRLYYSADEDAIYFIDEMYENHRTNREIADWIKDRKYDDYPVTCDSSEPRSVTDLRDMGINAKKAIKGPGSVNYGMKWLEGRKIYIDPNRTPNVMQEFANYEFERDKQGNVISGYPDKNNHTIDATRYALERFCNRRETQA